MTKSPNNFYDETRFFGAYRNRPNDVLVMQYRGIPATSLMEWAQKAYLSEETRARRGMQPRGVTLARSLGREEALQLANDIFRWFDAEPERWILSETEHGVTTYIDCINEEDAVNAYDHAANRYPNNLYRIFVQRGYGDMERVL